MNKCVKEAQIKCELSSNAKASKLVSYSIRLTPQILQQVTLNS